MGEIVAILLVAQYHILKRVTDVTKPVKRSLF